MRTAFIFIGTALLGGITFWLPSIALHAVRGDNFSGVDVLALTVFLPILAVVAAVAADRLQSASRVASFAPVAVGLGVWVLGPLAMFVSATPSGGGFATQDGWWTLLVLTASFPLTTFMMAAYDGSLGGLILGTVALVLLFIRGLTRASGNRVGAGIRAGPRR